jgi:hypothetical protein
MLLSSILYLYSKMKNTAAYLIMMALIWSSCSYTVYDMSRGELKIARKASYQVNYVTIAPNDTKVEVTYTDKDSKQHTEQFNGGRWDKTIELPSKQSVVFKVKTKLAKTSPVSNLVTTIRVDGAPVSEEVQTGKNVTYTFGFKLP